MAVGAALQPLPGCGQPRVKVGWLLLQRIGKRAAQQFTQGGRGSGQHRLRAAAGREQTARGFSAQPRCFQQPEPGGEIDVGVVVDVFGRTRSVRWHGAPRRVRAG